jgi:hypothetical protein
MRDRTAHKPTLSTAPERRRFGEWPTLAERVEKLEATAARRGEHIADLQKREAALADALQGAGERDRSPEKRIGKDGKSYPTLGRSGRDGPLVERPHKKVAAGADIDVLADLLATVIELRDDQAELREIVANLSKEIFHKPLPRRPPKGWATLKQAAGATGYSSERIRQWAVADEKLGRRRGGQWIVKLNRLPTRDAERN